MSVGLFRVQLLIDSRPVILNRGPHGPPGGNLKVLGRNTEHLGNWGGMDPFGGNQQIAINSPGCSSGWCIVAASPVFVDVTLRPDSTGILLYDLEQIATKTISAVLTS